jgi:hypothetical protein
MMIQADGLVPRLPEGAMIRILEHGGHEAAGGDAGKGTATETRHGRS